LKKQLSETPKKYASSGFYNGCDAMTIADYFAIGVLIVSIGWAGRRFLMTYQLSPRQSEPTSDQESQQTQTE
jgi:hypothetical protein